MHGGRLVALKELRPTPRRRRDEQPGPTQGRESRSNSLSHHAALSRRSLRPIARATMTPISAPASPPSQRKNDHLLYRRRARCDASRLEQLRLYTPDRAVRGTDIADVAIGHSVGGCFCVGGVLAVCGYRNDIGGRASDLNIVAKLIERHGWTDIRQRVQEHLITARDNLLGRRKGIDSTGGGGVAAAADARRSLERDQRGTREHRRLEHGVSSASRGCPGPPRNPQGPCAAARSAWTSAGPVPAGSSGLRLDLRRLIRQGGGCGP